MMKRTFWPAGLLALVFSLTIPSAPVFAAAGDDAQVRRDLEALKEGQEALRREIEEIKKQLQARPAPSARSAVQAIDAPVEIGDSPIKGDRDAKLTLMEFSDYQCPFCNRFAESTLPQVDREYIATGRLRYVFRDLPLATHQQAPKAAEAAHCAGDQGKYWEMHERLFASQPALGLPRLFELARALELQPELFVECLDSGAYAEKVSGDAAEARRLGISGTPTLLLGVSDGDRVKDVRVIRGAQSFAVLKPEIDKRLEGEGAPAGKASKAEKE